MSRELFGRSVRLIVGPAAAAKEIRDLRVKFEVEKSLEQFPNPATITVYNLSQKTRALIREPKAIAMLVAGYEGTEKLIYRGDIAAVTDGREGPDIVTELYCGDGEVPYQQAKVDFSFAPGATVGAVFDKVAEAFGLAKGAIAGLDRNQQFQGGVAFSGMARTALTKVLERQGLSWSVQNNQLQVTPFRDKVTTEVVLLSKESGLVGSPKRKTILRPDIAKPVDGKIAQSGFEVQALLNPDIRPGYPVHLKAEFVDGQFRVEKLKHTGDSRGSEFYTEAFLR